MLSPGQIQMVRLTLTTDGWTKVMLPALQQRVLLATKSLCLTRSERAVQYKGSDYDVEDDVLRAMIRDVEWMTFAWVNEIRVHDQNRQRDELVRQ